MRVRPIQKNYINGQHILFSISTPWHHFTIFTVLRKAPFGKPLRERKGRGMLYYMKTMC
jgi:hypothetical protein